MLYYASNTLDPTYNLATEYYLFHAYRQRILYLWINGPSIVVGKHQNTIEEINAKFVKDHKIEVCSRLSGGGTVYHDEGNLNYTIIDSDAKKKVDYKGFSQPIINALAKLGLTGSMNTTNSLTLDGYKICGHAQYIKKDRVIHHGCLLFDTDLSVLENALNVPKDKIKSKSTKSIRATVKNISDFLDQPYTIEDFRSVILNSMEETYGGIEPLSLDEKAHEAIEIIRQEKFTGWPWVYGKSPPFNIKRKRILPSGDFEVRLDIKNGCIGDLRFYGDFFETTGIASIEEALKGCPYEADSLWSLMASLDVTSVFQVSKEVFLGLLID